ncbi:3-deoxy-D-manno-octulosonic acid transferase [Aliiruegeria lutimaris]|uniref:3-deoxy-D-manno-octulosonic acid transferase n=1 Tax=Aliiruegeria lutimaris TaxID=571298 RepID=A0A1G8M8F1_9RHOB|nr:glycosyltransferase N-terminal domain-containing protein [Aliiruegeria lutimaris]SDI64107.1 3-deoxy-D-manno-octulosonic-acid transferase [Aliiruegeria lutimaris]
MDGLILPRLRAHLRASGQVRKLSSELERGGELGRNAAEQLARSDLARPDGPLVWCHVPGRIETGALASLVEGLNAEVAGTSMLVTSPDSARCRRAVNPSEFICQLPPLDSPRFNMRFLDYWAPDAGIWFERVDAPMLLDAAARRSVPLFLQNGVAPEATSPRSRAVERRQLGLFERIFVLDSHEFEGVRSLGAVPARVEITGRLTRIAHPPPCLEAERMALAEALRGRPSWLAAAPDPSEIPAILEAHRVARRSAHRLLLILMPREDSEGPALTRMLRSEGWNVARRDADEEPDEATDIFVADSKEEIGLFYRLAPVTFLGGTLSDTTVPMAIYPATLGSAILSGPYSGAEGETLRRLRRGGACRLVADSERLGAALTELLAPDRAALLALNAWDIASDGTQILERLVRAVSEALRSRTD